MCGFIKFGKVKSGGELRRVRYLWVKLRQGRFNTCAEL